MSDNIRKRGNIYYYDIMIDGTRYKGTTKTTDKNLAEKIASTIKTDIIRKKHDIPTIINYNDYDFGELWEQYVKSVSNVKRTIENKISISNHFLPIFKNKSIERISNLEIENYQLKRRLEVIAMPKNKDKRDSEISFAYLNKEILILSNFFNFCIKKGVIDKNPCTGIKKLNELSRLKTLSDEDIEKLINGATNKLTRDLITFLIYTGCRKGEALNLKWSDVDLTNNVIAIKFTKTRCDRYAPVHTHLKELLNGIEKNGEYVFNIDGKKIGNFRKSFITACKNAGLKDLHIHDLRHVFASKMVMNGTPLFTTGKLLGHKSSKMTERYSHLVPETLQKAVEDVFKKKL